MIENKIKQYVFKLLAIRALFVEELREKLLKKGFPQDEVEGVLAYCIRKGFVDDEAYAVRFLENEFRQGRSYAMAVQKYRLKNRASNAMEHIAQVDRKLADEKALDVCLKKCAKELASEEKKIRERLLRRLMQKGFSWELINRRVREYENMM